MATHPVINKGNYSMEPPEREALFEQRRAEGWEEAYQAYRQNWAAWPRDRRVGEYPLLVDLELSTTCNLACPMCYRRTPSFQKRVPAGFMDFTLFQKAIDEIAGRVPAVRLSLRGEPTLHPRFFDCIRYAKDRGIGEVSTLTNGTTLTAAFAERLLDSGLDWLTVSVDGFGEAYDRVRVPHSFSRLFEGLHLLAEAKRRRQQTRPVVKVQSIWPAIRGQEEAFYLKLSPLADLVAFNPLIDYLQKDDEGAIQYERDFSCCQLYQRLVVGFDGQALACSNDEESQMVTGNLAQQSVHKIWHGEALQRLRRQHAQPDGFKQLAICRKCYLPRLTEDSHTFLVQGRQVIVKNYVNRAQSVGT